MTQQKTLLTYVLIFLIVGAVGAGWFAKRNQTTSTQTVQLLEASMIELVNAAVSPRTYNQTLVESVDTNVWASSLSNSSLPKPTSIQFDVLPDSFNIQVTVVFNETLTDEQKGVLESSVTSLLSSQSQKLAESLFENVSTKVTAVKLLPESAVIEQNPTAATIYGAIAGALFGLFLGLALNQPKEKS